VYFSPKGGATDAVVREVNVATQQILVQEYSFTSAPIAKVRGDAHKRGVKVLAVLDKSNQTERIAACAPLTGHPAAQPCGHSCPSGSETRVQPLVFFVPLARPLGGILCA